MFNLCQKMENLYANMFSLLLHATYEVAYSGHL